MSDYVQPNTENWIPVFVAFRKNLQIALFGLGTLLAAPMLYGVASLNSVGPTVPWKIIIIAPLLFLIGAFSLVHALGAMFFKAPIFIITQAGLITDFSTKPYSPIPWKQISGIQLEGNGYLRVILKDPKTIISAARGMTKLRYKWNYSFYRSPIAVNTDAINITPQTLILTLREHIEGK